MRPLAAVLVASITVLSFPCFGVMAARSVYAQNGPGYVVAAAKKATAKKAAAKKKKSPPAPAPSSIYAGMPLAERVGIQFDLAWAGYYNGLIDGEFTDRSLAAVKAFQKDRKFAENGVLAAPERALLAALSKSKQEQVGWRMVDDRATGAQVGLPTTQVPKSSPAARGTRWSSAQGQVQVETFRIREPGATLATVFEQQKKEPANRRLAVNLMRNNFFILSGTQGLKKFYVRAQARDFEIRGITILWDPATEGIMDPVVVVMSSAFAPFPGTGLAAHMGPPRRRPIDYGTGIVASKAGHILADRQLTEDCKVIEIAGHGDADRLGEDAAAGLSLLRLYGATDLNPAALAADGAPGDDLTLVGIADPKLQGGGGAASTTIAKLNGDGIEPAPPLGFSGAAALDAQGRFAGMVALKTPVVASVGSAVAPLPQAMLVSAAAIRQFLESQSVALAPGRAGLDALKSSLVRVICVRR
jgi:peptidoglycan hydrolase-like protein with peptidoglycan-binding domain